MSIQTVLTKRLGMTHPIIQAPLAGGGDTPTLVASVCNAGGLAFIGAAYLMPEQIGDVAREVGRGRQNLLELIYSCRCPRTIYRAIRSRRWSALRVSSPSWLCRRRLSPRGRAIRSTNNWPQLSKAALRSSVSPSAFCQKMPLKRSRHAACF